MDKLKKDNGNATIVLGIMLIIATLVIGAMLLDLTKAFQLKSSYNDAARRATQSAIRYQDASGFITAEAIGEAVRVYENVTRPGVIKEGYMSACKDFEDVEITITAMDKDYKPGEQFTIKRSSIKEDDKVEDIIEKLTPSLGSSKAQREFVKSGQYTGVQIELHESTPNIILPKAAAMVKTKENPNLGEGLKCQLLGVRAGASQYIGEQGRFD